MSGLSGIGQRLRPRDMDEGAANTVHLIRSTSQVAVRDLTNRAGGIKPPAADQQVNNVLPAGNLPSGSETANPSADWDMISINQQLVGDFASEELNKQIDQGSDRGRIVLC